MKIFVTGSSGLVGSGLIHFLSTNGHEVVRCARAADGSLDLRGITEDLEAVVHLAGEPIAGRWTDERKRRIRESRVSGTRQLCEALAKLKHPPRVLASAS